MKRRSFLPTMAAIPLCGASVLFGEEGRLVRVVLDAENPDRSRLFKGAEDRVGMPVGLGKKGFLKAGEAFQGGFSLLGEFVVSSILSADRFEMTDALVQESGKSREWLAENLFSNMSTIDFDGDGKGGEYGSCFIGLQPINSTAKQPFYFGEYKGVFRWYSYAIHGTQDQSRIGKCVTGGCINVGAEALLDLAESLKPGDRVDVHGL